MTAAFLLCSSMAAGAALADGYDNREPQTPQDPCRIYDHCRTLTAGEIKMARRFYGAAIDYESVHIINGRYLGIFPLGNSYSGMSPDGNIYAVKPAIQSDDYSAEREKAHFFIHELFHVRQRNLGMNLIKQAFSLHAMSGKSPYAYKLEEDKPLEKYNFEQQAKIAEHAYIFGEFLRSGGVRYSELKQRGYALACQRWAALTRTLAGAVNTGKTPQLCR